MSSPRNKVQDPTPTNTSNPVPRPMGCWGLNPDYVKKVTEENNKAKAAKTHSMTLR